MKQSCTVLVLSGLLLLAACGGGGAPPLSGGDELSLPAPTGVSLSPQTGAATLSWDAVAGASAYHLLLADTAGITGDTSATLTADVAAGILSHTFEGLAPGLVYYAAVCAVGAPADSALSDEVSTQLAPGAASAVEAYGGNGSITVSWVAPVGCTGHEVFLAAAPEVGSATWNGLPQGAAVVTSSTLTTIEGLQNGTTYYLVVRGVNGTGAGPDSSPVSARPGARGTFVTPQIFGTGSRPISVATGDLDGDGRPDFAVCDGFDGKITFHLSVEVGQVEFAGDLPIEEPMDPGEAGEMPEPPGRHPLALADFDGDGALDLAVGLRPGAGVQVFLGLGGPAFEPGASLASGGDVASIASLDVDDDGVPDLVVADRMTDQVTVWRGDGLGGFSLEATLDVGSHPASVAAADLDADGRVDLVVADEGSNTVSVLMGVGGGDFEASASLDTAERPYDLGIGDLDGDGVPDLVASAAGSDLVQTWLGQGDGTFLPAGDLAVGNDPRHVLVRDFDGDGRADLVVSNFAAGSVGVYRGLGDGTFLLLQLLDMADDAPGDVAAADMGGDGVLDLVAVGAWKGGIWIFPGDR